MQDEQAQPAGAPPQGAPGGGGGGITEALVETDKNLAGIASVMAKNPQIPDEVKQAFQTASKAYRQGLQALTQLAGGGGDAGGPQPAPGGTATPEQGGGGGAVPMTPAGVQRG